MGKVLRVPQEKRYRGGQMNARVLNLQARMQCGDPMTLADAQFVGELAERAAHAMPSMCIPAMTALERARLAAAPDLLEALEHIANEPIGDSEASFREVHDAIVGIARAALAKAREAL